MFRHQTHAALRLPCLSCHPGAAKAERAGFPSAGSCMVCHVEAKKESDAIRALAALPVEEVLRPRERAYQVPDFVFFSHALHSSAKLECTSCHGDVAKHEHAEPARLPIMKACVDCHKEREAATECTTCHELGQ